MDNRISWVDQARGIALILVVIGHMGIPYIGQYFTTVHLPLFFFLSGLTFSIQKGFGAFLIGKVKRLLVPYFCLGIPLLMSSLVTRMREGITDISSYCMVLVKFFLQKRHYTIWFLTCLFVASILLYGIIRAVKNRLGWVLGAGIGSAVMCIAYWELGGTPLLWNIDAAFLAVFFMALGYYIKMSGFLIRERFFKCCFFFIAAAGYIACVTINGFFYGEKFDMAICQIGLAPVSLLGILCGIYCIVFFLKCFNLGCILEYLGQNTMVYFAWHQSIMLPLLLDVYNFFGWFTTNSIVSDIIRTVLSIILIFLTLLPFDLLFGKTKLCFVVGK